MPDSLVRLQDVLDAVQAVADRHAAIDAHHAQLAADAAANRTPPADPEPTPTGGPDDGQ